MSLFSIYIFIGSFILILLTYLLCLRRFDFWMDWIGELSSWIAPS